MQPSVAANPVSVDQTVRDVFAHVLQIDGASLHEGTHLVNDLAVDSLDALELALKIQERLQIQLDDEDFSRFTTYGELLAAVHDNVARHTGERRRDVPAGA